MRVLAVDWGERRIGLAISDPDGTIAFPLKTLEVKDPEHAIDDVLRAIDETQCDKVVVGLPLNMNGTRGPVVQRVEEFMRALQTRVKVSVVPWDERLTSQMAERSLLEADMSRRKRRGTRDRIAAQIVLQGYLDSEHSEAHPDNHSPVH